MLKGLSELFLGLDADHETSTRLDAFLRRESDYQFSQCVTILKNNSELIYARKFDREVNYWKKIACECGSKLQDKFNVWNQMEKQAKANSTDGVNLSDIYIPLLKVDENHFAHDYLMGRVRTENAVYGNFPLHMWFSFFLNLNILSKTEKDDRFKYNLDVQLSEMLGILSKTNYNPFRITKADNSNIEYVNGFYNIINVFEVLLNISTKRKLNLNSKSFDLHQILDEMTLNIVYDSKRIIKEIRGFLTFCSRMTGMLSTTPVTLKHDGFQVTKNFPTNSFTFCDLKATILQSFMETETYKENLRKGLEQLEKYKLFKLKDLCCTILQISLKPVTA